MLIGKYFQGVNRVISLVAALLILLWGLCKILVWLLYTPYSELVLNWLKD